MKRKFVKRITALLCVTAMVMTAFTACGNKPSKVDNSGTGEKTLKILMRAKGYGTQWLEAAADAFEKKNEGVTVDITLVNSAEVIQADIKNVEFCDTDLYIDIVELSGHKLLEEYKYAYENSQAMRDMTALYSKEIPGEGITYKEKMNDSILYACTVDGRTTEDESDDTYFFAPYVTGAMGLYYNETVIDNALGKGNWEVPNTTDELIALCKRLQEKECMILLPGSMDQWTASLFLPWWSQYEGQENYRKFFEGIGFEKNSGMEAEYSASILEQPGRLASLEASYDLISYDNGFAPKNAVEINTNNLNEYQTRFTLSKFNYAFYPCGDWLMQELKNNSTIESDSVIKLMKTPVISSIIDSTNSYSRGQEKRLPNITSDEMLSQVIDYVDGNGELPAGVTEEEVAFVADARNAVASKALEHVAYAPAFSNAAELADEFLLFLASDEGIKIFKENCIGGFAPFDYEFKDLSVTEQSVYEATKNAIYVDDFCHNELFYRAGISGTNAGTSDTLESLLCKPNGKTAQELFDMMIAAYGGAKWATYLTAINR